jgi:hypothetical protein
MERTEIMDEAGRWMARANEVQAGPDDVLKILSLMMGQLLHEHAADADQAGHIIVQHNLFAIEFYTRQQERREQRRATTLH